MRLVYASFLVLLQASVNHAFAPSQSHATIICHQTHKHQLLQRTSGGVPSTQLSSSKEDDGGGGDGWYDDYDDFVSNLDFEGGGWDSGADSPFDSNNNRGGGRSRFGGGGRGGRGSSYGNKGHDYQRDSRDSSPIDEAVVDELLASRLHYRKKRLFDAADDIRDELLNVHGVTIWDKDRTWTTAKVGRNERGGSGGGGRGGGGRGRGGGDRFNNRFDSPRGRSGRGSGRGRGRERQFNEFGHDYTQAGGPVNPDVCKLPEEQIHEMIRTRMESKFARDFNTADGIEYELRQAGVDVNDGFKEWRADGEQWGRSNRRDRGGFGGDRGPLPPKVYYQRGPGKGLSEEVIETINSLVAERSEAKASTNYPRADEIFDQLQNEYNVNVDDKNGEWALLNEEYLLNTDTTSFVPTDDVQTTIGNKLGERILARKARDFALADDIRDELRSVYTVEIDDRSKEWIVVAPEGARWAGDDEEDDDANVVSRQEWEEEDETSAEVNSDEEQFDETSDMSHEEDGEEDSSIAEEESELDESTLSTLTVPQLKEKLREAGLPVSGRKSELIERLVNG